MSDGGLGIEVAIIGKTLKNVWRARVRPRKRELQPTGAINGLAWGPDMKFIKFSGNILGGIKHVEPCSNVSKSVKMVENGIRGCSVRVDNFLGTDQ